jgi:tripartite-type tricarboxylate transporter receptor subunit TctC
MKPSLLARGLAAAVLMSVAAVATSQTAQTTQNYPAKPIRIIVPYAPGASTDAMARLFGTEMQKTWGQSVFNDYKPGGNTIIGSEALTKSPADGYTILLVVNTHAINPLLSKLPYDPIKDFAPITTIGVSEYMLAVHPSVPANTLKDFVAYAKSKNGELNYSTSGAGGLGHLSAELFNMLAGVKSQHIPFKGGAPSVQALVAGEVQLCFIHPINVLSLIKAGKLKAIAISGKNRLATLPDMPTFAEAGMPALESTNWFGMLAPAGTPRDILNKLSAEMNRTQMAPEMKEKLTAQGVEPFPGSPDQFAALIKSDMDKFAKVVKAANIKLEN